MKKSTLFLAVAFALLLAGCGVGASAPDPSSLVRDDVFVLSLPGVDAEENLHFFDYDEQAPLDIQEVGTSRAGNVTSYDITYASPKGGRVPAYLIVPDGPGPFAGIVLMHGGALDSSRSDFSDLGTWYASLGAAVIIIDAPWNRPEYGPGTGSPRHSPTPQTFTEQDREEQIQLILDLRRAVDLLLARPDVDPGRIAYVGFSYGGAMGGLLAGVEDRLQAYVLVVGDGGLVAHYTNPDELITWPRGPFYRLSQQQQERWLEAMWPIEPIHYVGRAAPAALLFQNGLKDTAVPPYDAARYHEAGSEPKRIVWYDSDHSLPDQSFLDQARWLQRYIGAGHLLFLGPGYRPSAVVFDRLLLVWSLLTVGSLGFVIWDLVWGTPAPWGMRLLWPLAIVFFGPLGLLVYVVSHRRPQRSLDATAAMTTSRRALGSTVWSAAGNSIGAIVALGATAALQPLDPRLQLALAYVLPLVTGLLTFFLARMASLRDRRYRAAFRRPLLAEVVSTNMVLTGALLVQIILLNRLVTGLALPLIWSVLSLAAVAGALVAYPLHVWLIRRGVVYWGLPLPVGEHVERPQRGAGMVPWYAALGIVLLSYVLVIAAVVVSVAFVMDLGLSETARLVLSSP